MTNDERRMTNEEKRVDTQVDPYGNGRAF